MDCIKKPPLAVKSESVASFPESTLSPAIIAEPKLLVRFFFLVFLFTATMLILSKTNNVGSRRPERWSSTSLAQRRWRLGVKCLPDIWSAFERVQTPQQPQQSPTQCCTSCFGQRLVFIRIPQRPQSFAKTSPRDPAATSLDPVAMEENTFFDRICPLAVCSAYIISPFVFIQTRAGVAEEVGFPSFGSDHSQGGI